MAWRVVLVAIVASAGCGRLGFDDRLPALDGSTNGSADAAEFFGSPRCPINVILCDDFEAPQISSLWSVNNTTNGTVAIDSSRGARGSGALHFVGNTVAMGNQVRVTIRHVIGAGWPSPTFMRAFIFAPTLAPMRKEVFSSLGRSSGTDGVQIEADADGTVMLDGWGVSGQDQASATPFPIGRWVCVEWAVTRGTPGSLSMWIDDAPIAGLQAVPWTTTSPLEIFDLRLDYNVAVAGSHEIWFDEVIADGARIGCAR